MNLSDLFHSQVSTISEHHKISTLGTQIFNGFPQITMLEVPVSGILYRPFNALQKQNSTISNSLLWQMPMVPFLCVCFRF